MLPVHNKIVKMVITIITWFQNTDFFQNRFTDFWSIIWCYILSDFENEYSEVWGVERVVSLLSEFFQLAILFGGLHICSTLD